MELEDIDQERLGIWMLFGFLFLFHVVTLVGHRIIQQAADINIAGKFDSNIVFFR